MLLVDVNVLVYAHRQHVRRHDEYRAWMQGVLSGDEPYGMAELTLSGFLRIVTDRRIFNPPTPLENALAFTADLLEQPHCVPIRPGTRHWGIFTDLCRRANVKGPLVADAYLAALAIESGSEWITTDRDFSRFPGLRWRHPLD